MMPLQLCEMERYIRAIRFPASGRGSLHMDNFSRSSTVLHITGAYNGRISHNLSAAIYAAQSLRPPPSVGRHAGPHGGSCERTDFLFKSEQNVDFQEAANERVKRDQLTFSSQCGYYLCAYLKIACHTSESWLPNSCDCVKNN